MTPHTPGPWSSVFAAGAHVIRSARRTRSIAQALHDGPEDAANARLLAAAPELVQALSDLIDVNAEGHADELSEDETHDATRCAFCAAVAILARATGTEVTT